MVKFFFRIYNSKSFYQYRAYWYLLGISILFIILRLPSLVEPHWYGDEGVYQVVGRALNEGRVLYKEVWDNKPPLLYIIYALAEGNLFVVKSLSLFSGLLSVVVFYFLSLKLFKKTLSSCIATMSFAILFGSPVIEGNIANAENFMLFPIVLSAYCIFLFEERKKNTWLIASGFLLSIALMIKIVAFFDFAAFLTFLYLSHWESNKYLLRRTSHFVLPFCSLLFIFLLYFIAVGGFKDFINGVFLQNVSYVGEQYGSAFPAWMLIVKVVLLVCLVSIVVWKRKKINTSTTFIYLWTIFGIYNAFFSDRPYTHYLLVLLPAFCLLIGHFFELRKKTRIIDLGVIIIIAFLAYYHFGIYKKTRLYYGNFLQFIADKKDTTSYQTFFDRNTPRDYDLANFIKSHTSRVDKVFLLSDSAQIYALSNKLPIGKYVVFYHITYYKNASEDTEAQIEKEKPKYIIQTTNNVLIKHLLSSYELKYIMEGTKIYEREI